MWIIVTSGGFMIDMTRKTQKQELLHFIPTASSGSGSGSLISRIL